MPWFEFGNHEEEDSRYDLQSGSKTFIRRLEGNIIVPLSNKEHS